MRKSKILARMRAGQPARSVMLAHVMPPFVAYAADAGFDGIWLDLEHRPMDTSAVQMLLAFSHLYDIDMFIRSPTREKAQLYRYLEDGAAGLMIPHVSTPEEVEDLVSKTRFPPVGDRGLAPSNLQANYGLDVREGGRQVLVDHAQRETFLFVQVETPLGLQNAAAMAAVPGVAGLYLGPADLALRMQYEAEDSRVSYEGALEILAEACQAEDKFWGAWPRNLADLQLQHRLGAKLLQWGVDSDMVMQGLQENMATLNALPPG